MSAECHYRLTPWARICKSAHRWASNSTLIGGASTRDARQDPQRWKAGGGWWKPGPHAPPSSPCADDVTDPISHSNYSRQEESPSPKVELGARPEVGAHSSAWKLGAWYLPGFQETPTVPLLVGKGQDRRRGFEVVCFIFLSIDGVAVSSSSGAGYGPSFFFGWGFLNSIFWCCCCCVIINVSAASVNCRRWTGWWPALAFEHESVMGWWGDGVMGWWGGWFKGLTMIEG